MPVSKRRKKDEARKRRGRDAPAAAPASPAEPPRSSGLLSRMRGGFQKVAGTAPSKPESTVSKIVTWIIVLVAAYFVARRLGWVP
ncbi:MAG TPA: hypothetical protein VFL36_09195 [Myxococcales bacterium]|nr:hypothetical protein [Myxococcales bacterium]